MSDTDQNEGWEWCFVEIMGHRSHWGKQREIEKFGSKFMRVDVPIDGDPAGKWETHLYSGAAIFCLTPATEDMVMKRNKPYMRPSPLQIEDHSDDEQTEEDDRPDHCQTADSICHYPNCVCVNPG